MCPASITRGLPAGFTTAMVLPMGSVVTSSANGATYSRKWRALGASNPEGDGVSIRRSRNASAASVGIRETLPGAAYGRAFSLCWIPIFYRDAPALFIARPAAHRPDACRADRGR
jgi:hypothetical protein